MTEESFRRLHRAGGALGSERPRVCSLRIATDPVDARLALRASNADASRHAVLGWVTATRATDAGVPPAVVRMLARALCAAGEVTYLDSTIDVHGGDVWLEESGGLARCITPALLGRVAGRPPFPLRRTNQPSVVERMFDDSDFSWTLRSQFALVATPDSPPPASIDYARLFEIWNASTSDLEASLAALGQTAVVYAGVDGDFAEFAFFDEPQWTRFMDALGAEAASSRTSIEQVRAQDFPAGPWTHG